MSSGSTQMIHLRGRNVRVLVQRGESGRPPLLLCNGIGAPVEMFDSLRAALGDHPTVSFDAPGTGKSTVPLFPPSLAGLADIVVEVLDELGVDQVDVLGLSWGGLLAQAIARRHGDRVRRLVLVSTLAGGFVVPPSAQVTAVMLTPARYWSMKHLRSSAKVIFKPELEQEPDFVEGHGNSRLANPPSLMGYFWQLLAMRWFASAYWLGSVKHRTLIMHGTRDPIARPVNARILKALIPDATLRLIEGGGHLFLMTRAAEVAPEILEFLNGPEQ